MRWRYAVGVLVVVLFAGVRAAIGIPQSIPPAAVYEGHLDMAMGADGRLLVLIDLDTGRHPADGLVDHSFRLQGAPALAYSGPARATYVRNRLAIRIGDSFGWVFTVAGRPMPPADPALTPYDVHGIAHIWGDTFHEPAATLLTTLSASPCTAGSLAAPIATARSGGGGCQDCSWGGEGSASCSSAGCSDGSSCSTDCSEGTFACCACGGLCQCCTPREGGSPHH